MEELLQAAVGYLRLLVAGILIAYITAFALSPFEAWRWMLGLAIIPAILLFVGMYFMPETPAGWRARGRSIRRGKSSGAPVARMR